MRLFRSIRIVLGMAACGAGWAQGPAPPKPTQAIKLPTAFSGVHYVYRLPAYSPLGPVYFLPPVRVCGADPCPAIGAVHLDNNGVLSFDPPNLSADATVVFDISLNDLPLVDGHVSRIVRYSIPIQAVPLVRRQTLQALDPAAAAAPVEKEVSQEKPLVYRVSINSSSDTANVIYFNRKANALNRTPLSNQGWRNITGENADDAPVVAEINSSKVILSGTVLQIANKDNLNNCGDYDWTTVALSSESSSYIVYGPQDVSVFCASDTEVDIVLPVYVRAAEITGVRGDLNDPQRKAPAPASLTATACLGPDGKVRPEPVIDITPCDYRNSNSVRQAFYETSWLYNRLTQPGVFTGGISYTPTSTPGSQSLTYDLQLAPSTRVGHGWIGLPVTLEKSQSPAGDLNSLTASLTYNGKFADTSAWWSRPDGALTFRPPDYTLQFGPEIVPSLITPTPIPPAVYSPITIHDINLLAGVTLHQPVVVRALKQPSFLSLFPAISVYGGDHLQKRYPTESGEFYRWSTGIDASIRWPFRLAPNFISTKPITFDYSYRTTWLGSPEPYTDTLAKAAADGTDGFEYLTSRRRSFTKFTLNEPLSSYLSLKFTILKGSLPPDFRNVRATYLLSLSLASTGTVEH